jgi:hypothetical protein
LKLRTLIWLGPIVFLIHDLEEVFTVENWVKGHQSTLSKIEFVNTILKSVGYTTSEFALTVAFIFFMYVLISHFASKNITGWGMICFMATILIMFVNVFTHLAQTILLGIYTPGVITALVVVLPFTILVFRTLMREKLLSKKALLRSVAIGLFFVPVIFAPLFIFHRLLSWI